MTILADDTSPYILLLPQPPRAGGPAWRLTSFWQGLYDEGFIQATQGGYSPFRLLVRKEAVVTGPSGQGTSSYELHTGSFVALASAQDSRVPQGQVGCGYLVLGVAPTLDAAFAYPGRAACLIASVSAIGFPDGGIAAGVKVHGRSITFLSDAIINASRGSA